MSEYAVTNPATGERVKDYPTISDAALADAIATADRAHREWSRATTIEERAALVRRVGELHTERRDELAEIIVREMGKPVEQALGEVDFCATIYELLRRQRDEPARRRADHAVRRRGVSVRAPQLRRRRCSGSCRGTSRTTRWRVSPGRISSSGNTILLKHAPQCPESAEAIQADLRRCGLPRGRVHEHLRHERAGRRRHRRPARAGRVGHRLRASGRGGRRDRRTEPEEGRARARRLGSVHPAEHGRPRRRRGVRRRGTARQRRPGL